MKLHDKFGLTPEHVAADLRVHALKVAETASANITSAPWSLNQCCFLSSVAAAAFYLMGDHESARAFGRRVVPAASNYLLGDWLTKKPTDLGHIDPDWWYDKVSWVNAFQAALCWGSALGDWNNLRRLSAYPNERRHKEKNNPDSKPALRQLLLDVSSHLRGDKVHHSARRVGAMPGAKWRGVGTLAACLDSIVDRNAKAAEASINEYLKLRHKRKRSNDITDTISMDATYMINIARHDGLHVDIDPKYQMYVITI